MISAVRRRPCSHSLATRYTRDKRRGERPRTGPADALPARGESPPQEIGARSTSPSVTRAKTALRLLLTEQRLERVEIKKRRPALSHLGSEYLTCEGPGWPRTEHMQQESGYVGGVPKMAAGAEAFLEDAGCWQASLQNARELLEAAGARERARVGGSGRRVDCPRAWLAPGSPEEGTTPRPAKEGWRWPGVISL